MVFCYRRRDLCFTAFGMILKEASKALVKLSKLKKETDDKKDDDAGYY